MPSWSLFFPDHVLPLSNHLTRRQRNSLRLTENQEGREKWRLWEKCSLAFRNIAVKRGWRCNQYIPESPSRFHSLPESLRGNDGAAGTDDADRDAAHPGDWLRPRSVRSDPPEANGFVTPFTCCGDEAPAGYPIGTNRNNQQGFASSPAYPAGGGRPWAEKQSPKYSFSGPFEESVPGVEG